MKILLNDFQAYSNQYKTEYLRAFNRTLDSGWYILGKEVEAFESEFAKYLGVKHCIGVANGLEALQIVLMAHNIGKGDEVITTPVSAFATTLAIESVGAVPVFVDTASDGQIDPRQVSEAITKKTKALLPVHLYGNSSDLMQLRKIADQHNLVLIEDAAQAQGTTHKNKKVGTTGDANCFSFYPTKNLGALGDGGAIVTNNEKISSICKVLRDYGQEKKYVHTRFGLNSRLDEVQAAFLRIRLQHLDSDNEARIQLAKIYSSHLKKIEAVTLISPIKGGNGHLCVIRAKQRDALKEFLAAKGIETAVHYPVAIPDQPVYGSKYSSLGLPNARQLSSEVLTLPCHPMLTESEVLYVCQSIQEYFV